MNKRGQIPIMTFFSAIPFLIPKAIGLLLSSLGAFFVFAEYNKVGFTTELIPTIFMAVILVMVGQYLFWMCIFKEGEEWKYSSP